MGEPSLQELHEVAVEAALLGGRRTLAYFNCGVSVELKGDQTPVTQADREAEQIIRAHIARYYPDHSVIGEEAGEKAGRRDYRWIIDPIDGTKTFIRGVPLYGTLIGVEVNGAAAVGVVYIPALNELLSAAQGHGCWWNGRRARVSRVADLRDAALMCTNIYAAQKRSEAINRLAASTLLQRTWGDCYGYVLVATGRAEVMVDAAMNAWDCAPLLPILQEAGGHFTNWRGEATIWGRDAVATNAALHTEVLDLLRED
jgi:histidinol phosphatase-like enzyme (inositol monophosphatase family)